MESKYAIEALIHDMQSNPEGLTEIYCSSLIQSAAEGRQLTIEHVLFRTVDSGTTDAVSFWHCSH